jgi:ATP-dependent 26S proteasome regulatory subunit
MPEFEERREIWRRAFPAQTPLQDVDVEQLARQYDEISGGQIKLIAIGASMLAAGEDSKVTMSIIDRAYINELVKMRCLVKETNGSTGKPVAPSGGSGKTRIASRSM